MAIISYSFGANLSAEFLQNETKWPQLLRNDYLTKNIDVENLFANDVELDARLVIAEDEIVLIDARLVIAEAAIIANAAAISANTVSIGTNAANIATNATNISINANAIADINDGRYEPQFGSGSPEAVVTANLNGFYSDTSVPTLWVNDTPGANTGWVQLV